MHLARPALLAVASLAFASCQSADLVEPRTPTPQRPTLSQNTQTAAFGTIELEVGAEIDPNDRFDAPVTARWGLSETSEFFIGLSAYTYEARTGPDADGVGDVVVGFKERLMEETDRLPATAFQLSAQLPFADDDLASSAPDAAFTGYASVAAAAIVDKSFGSFNTTGYYRLGLLDNSTPSDMDAEHLLAAAVNRRILDKFVGLAEIAFRARPEVDLDQWFLTLGGYYELTELFWIDAGVRLGISAEAPDFAAFVGFSTNFGRLF